jgi:flagella basal body P-ring formation protein FlgA
MRAGFEIAVRTVVAVLAGLMVAVTPAAASPGAAPGDVRELPVARVTIYPGDLIGAQMLATKNFRVDPKAKLTVHDSADELLGKVARRTLLPGQLIPINAVKAPDVVKQGRPVPIVFEAGGLVISAIGIALQAGAPGDYITVQNPDSGITIKGIVGDDGSVKEGAF